MKRTASAFLKTPNSELSRDCGRVLNLEPEAQVGLVGSVALHRLVERDSRERARRRLAADRLEGRDDGGLHDVEHVLTLGERHLEIELPELELAVGAEILVAPAGGDLVVAVEAADHAELFEDLRRLREREELSGLQAHGHEKVACAFGRAARHARRPHVDEVLGVHRPADPGDRRVLEAEVPLHVVATEVEPAIFDPQRLVDVLLVQLERQGRRAREDAQPVDLDLDVTGRQVRVDRVGCAGDDLPFGLEHELVANLAGDFRGVGGALGVDDELELAGVVAQVDEDEPAVVAARVRPPGDCDPLPDVVTPRFAAIEVAPAHAVSVATTSARATSCSPRPSRLIVAPSARTITTVCAPLRPACVICPLNERPA